jgi:hypothetical protein
MNIVTFATINLIPSVFYGWITISLLQNHIHPPAGVLGLVISAAITLAPLGTIITRHPIWLVPNALLTILGGVIYYRGMTRN